MNNFVLNKVKLEQLSQPMLQIKLINLSDKFVEFVESEMKVPPVGAAIAQKVTSSLQLICSK